MHTSRRPRVWHESPTGKPSSHLGAARSTAIHGRQLTAPSINRARGGGARIDLAAPPAPSTRRRAPAVASRRLCSLVSPGNERVLTENRNEPAERWRLAEEPARRRSATGPVVLGGPGKFNSDIKCFQGGCDEWSELNAHGRELTRQRATSWLGKE